MRTYVPARFGWIRFANEVRQAWDEFCNEDDAGGSDVRDLKMSHALSEPAPGFARHRVSPLVTSPVNIEATLLRRSLLVHAPLGPNGSPGLPHSFPGAAEGRPDRLAELTPIPEMANEARNVVQPPPDLLPQPFHGLFISVLPRPPDAERDWLASHCARLRSDSSAAPDSESLLRQRAAKRGARLPGSALRLRSVEPRRKPHPAQRFRRRREDPPLTHSRRLVSPEPDEAFTTIATPCTWEGLAADTASKYPAGWLRSGAIVLRDLAEQMRRACRNVREIFR
jgi:hypothetical protein